MKPFLHSRIWLPTAVLIFGIGLSGAAAWLLQASTRKAAELTFDQKLETLVDIIGEQFARPVPALQGLSALMSVQPQLSQNQFAAFVREQASLRDMPGVRGFGWYPRVLRAQAPAYVVARRAGGNPDFGLRSLGDDRHADLFPVQWIEPMQGNFGTVGVDIGSEPHRRAAIEQAARSGEATLSAVIGLVQDRQRRSGFVLVVPNYWPDMPRDTEAQRLAALRGVVVAPLVAPELLARLTAEFAPHLRYEIRDVAAQAGAATLFYDSTTSDGLPHAVSGRAQPAARFERIRPLQLAGHAFELHARSTPQFDAARSDRAPLVAFAAGLLASGLLAALAAQLVKGRRVAERRADQLEDDRDRLAMVARVTSNSVIMTDAQRRITWVNAGFERMSGYTADEVLGRTPRSFLLFEGTDPATVQRMDQAMQAGQAVRCEILNRSKAGRMYWTTKEIQPLRDVAGALVGFMSIESDITDRLQAEATIRATQSTLETTGRIGGIGGWAFDLKSLQIELTDQTCRILDLLPGHVPTLLECFDWCAPQARQELEAAVEQGLAGGPSWDFELPFITAKGREIWVRLVAECEYADSGALRIVGALQDITARRAIEAAAQRNEALLRGAIDAIDEAFVLYDPDDRLVFCNEKYRSLYATSADLLVPGARFEDIVRTGALRGQYTAAIGRVEEWVAERLASHHSGNSRLVQKIDDGRTLRIVERKMPDGHLVGFRIDISDLVRATEAAEAGNRAKSEFIGTMSHELRTPLQWIIGYAELGGDMARGEALEQVASMFDIVLRGGHRMLSLVNDLLDLSAIDTTALALVRGPEDLRALAQAVCAELAPQAEARDVRIELSASMPALPVHVDASRMGQVIRNVLGNAIRYTPVGSAVTLDGVDSGPLGIELTVRDQGPGIPPGELELVFDAFVQSTRTRDGSGGSGLGLTVSRRIMAAHGGTITAENAVPVGSVLRLHLPAAPLQFERAQPIDGIPTTVSMPAPASPTTESAA